MSVVDAAAMLAVGVAAGVLGGLFGIGGGLVIVPALVLLVGLNQKTATGTSLFALLWPVGALGVWEYWRRGEMRGDLGTWIAIGLVGGIFLGAKLTAPLSPATMKRAYGVFLIVIGIYYLATTKEAKPAPASGPAAGEAAAEARE